MKITKEQLIDDLYKKTGFYKTNIRKTLEAIDELIIDYYSEIEEGIDLSIAITPTVKIGGRLVPERERIKPDTRERILVKPTVKPFARFSDKFREAIQDNYEKLHQDE